MAASAKVQAPQILMPKAKAVWLYENTMLDFQQIADFCGLHVLDVKAIADGQGAKIIGQSPIMDGDLTAEEIKRCEADPKTRLMPVQKIDRPAPVARAKGPRYTPVSKRADKPGAILYLVKNNPELTDAQIVRLVGTTKNTIKTIREKTHADYSNLVPVNPAEAGLCTMDELLKTIEKARKARPQQAVEDTAPQAEKFGTQLEDNSFNFSAFMGNAGYNSDNTVEIEREDVNARDFDDEDDDRRY